MNRCWIVVALGVLPACIDVVGEPRSHDEWDDKLAERVVDYSAALRIAALRLTGELPTLAELRAVGDAPGDAARKAVYEAQIGRYVESPRFARQMFRFWQDTLKLGDDPKLDSAPAFVARLAVEDRSFLEVLTARTGTCTSFDPATARFTPADCANTQVTVGLLTHPGMNAQFFSNLGFRRVRWVQETFACTAFPAEIAPQPKNVGGTVPYTGTFPFASIAGTASGGRVDFRDTSSVICANCHSNINHLAPLFASFDDSGVDQGRFVVPTPLRDAPPAELRDYLPAGEPLAWRSGVTVTDMAGLGAAMAADPEISACVIARLWNWALGKADIVDGTTRGPAATPPATIEQQVAAFEASGHRLRRAILDILTSDDFIRF